MRSRRGGVAAADEAGPAEDVHGKEDGNFFVGVHQYIGARGTVPAEFADRALLPAGAVDEGADAETVAVAWAGGAAEGGVHGKAGELLGAPKVHRFRTEDAGAGGANTAAGHGIGKEGIVGHVGDDARATAFIIRGDDENVGAGNAGKAVLFVDIVVSVFSLYLFSSLCRYSSSGIWAQILCGIDIPHRGVSLIYKSKEARQIDCRASFLY